MFSTSHFQRRGLARPAARGPGIPFRLTPAERRDLRRRALFANAVWSLAFASLGGMVVARLIG
jgi:hypothetical protein